MVGGGKKGYVGEPKPSAPEIESLKFNFKDHYNSLIA